MRIDAMSQVSQLYQTKGTKKYNQISAGNVSDSLEISQFGKDLQVARAALSGAADVREDRVAELKKAFEDGTYHVSDEAVAEALLQRFEF